MQETKTIMVEQKDIVKVTCDGCHSESTMISDMGTIKITFGYGSDHDGEVWEGEICDTCFPKLQQLLKLRLTHSEFGINDTSYISRS